MTNQVATQFYPYTNLRAAFPLFVERALSITDPESTMGHREILWRSFALDGGPVATMADLKARLDVSQRHVTNSRSQILETLRSLMVIAEGDDGYRESSLATQIASLKSDLASLGCMIRGRHFRQLVAVHCGEPLNPRWFWLLAAVLGYRLLNCQEARQLDLPELWVDHDRVPRKMVVSMLTRLNSIQGQLSEVALNSLADELRKKHMTDEGLEVLTLLVQVCPDLEIHHGMVRTMTDALRNSRDRNIRVRRAAKAARSRTENLRSSSEYGGCAGKRTQVNPSIA